MQPGTRISFGINKVLSYLMWSDLILSDLMWCCGEQSEEYRPFVEDGEPRVVGTHLLQAGSARKALQGKPHVYNYIYIYTYTCQYIHINTTHQLRVALRATYILNARYIHRAGSGGSRRPRRLLPWCSLRSYRTFPPGPRHRPPLEEDNNNKAVCRDRPVRRGRRPNPCSSFHPRI